MVIFTVLKCVCLLTVNHLIFMASKFGEFKRLTFRRSLILAVSQFNALYSYFILIGLTLKGKNMLPMGAYSFL